MPKKPQYPVQIDEDENIQLTLTLLLKASCLSYSELERRTGLAKSTIQRAREGHGQSVSPQSMQILAAAIGLRLVFQPIPTVQ